MKWFYSILGSGNRKVKDSDPLYDTEADALKAANEYMHANKAKVMDSKYPNENFSITAGRK
jgi:hypothetical protein